MSEPIVRNEFTGEPLQDERRLEAALRPRTLDDFVGQALSTRLVTELLEDGGKFGRGRFVQEVGGGGAGAGHPHVE